jgi:membrane associated rhomboid family serine protease
MVAAMDSEPQATVVCYRHPDRATRLACSECERPICVECSLDAAVGQKCPECSVNRGRARVIQARSMTHMDRRTTPVALALIVVNVGVFLVGMVSPELEQDMFREGAQWRRFIEAGDWWRPFTAMFLHSGITHILFNMWALWLFGPTLERRYGSAAFAGLYLAAGLNGGALFHAFGNNNPAVGASGAIFGLFGALLVASYRQRHTMAGRAVFNQLSILLIINLALPFMFPRIAWEAHVGGLLAGLVIAWAWDRLPHDAPGALIQRAVIAFAVAAAAVTLILLL